MLLALKQAARSLAKSPKCSQFPHYNPLQAQDTTLHPPAAAFPTPGIRRSNPPKAAQSFPISPPPVQEEKQKKKKKKGKKRKPGREPFGTRPGIGLIRRRRPTLPLCAVPSARRGLTALFGMGRGGTPALWPPQ